MSDMKNGLIPLVCGRERRLIAGNQKFGLDKHPIDPKTKIAEFSKFHLRSGGSYIFYYRLAKITPRNGSANRMSDTPNNAETEREFTALYVQCQRRLYTYILMLVGDPLAAHDILQDTNLVLWEKFGEFQRGTNFFAFAREIARYRVLRYRQIHTRGLVLIEPELLNSLVDRVNDSEASSDHAFDNALKDCLAKLNDSDHHLIRQRYAPGFSVKEFAQQSGRSENAVSQSLKRIRQALRTCIERTLSRAEWEGLS